MMANGEPVALAAMANKNSQSRLRMAAIYFNDSSVIWVVQSLLMDALFFSLDSMSTQGASALSGLSIMAGASTSACCTREGRTT